MTNDGVTNAFVIGRLLEEISWEGPRVWLYRKGGRGMENVLTAEVLLPLSYLPRQHFLGEVLRSAHGAATALGRIAEQIEHSELSVLPPQLTLQPRRIVVQPDALIETPEGYVLVEAKRLRRSSFRPEQLVREYLALLQEAGTRDPVLLLILGDPSARHRQGSGVRGQGLLEIHEAIANHLPHLLAIAGDADERLNAILRRVPEVVSWITWAELDSVVVHQMSTMGIDDASLRAVVERLAAAVSTAIATHS